MADYALEGPRWGTGGLGTAGGVVTWAIDSTIPSWFVPYITSAFLDWATYANITFQQVGSTASSQIDFTLGAIDGLNNVLGVANYSYSGTRLLSASIEFDSGEGWHLSGSQISSNAGVNFFSVALHEIGHAIGLDHYNVSPAIMNSYASASINDLTQSDVHGIQALYGAAPTVKGLPNDFNGDAHADILWQNSNGSLAVWTMGSGGQILTGDAIGSNPGLSWHIQTNESDFNGDGRSDILWRNDNGALAIWTMAGTNGTQITSGKGLAAQMDSSWSIQGSGDFNGDGRADILWRHTSGALAEWQMNGSQVSSTSNLAAQPDPTWKVQSIADFNGDGNSDVLWRSTTGTVNVWAMNGASISGNNVAVQPDLTWHVAGTGDFDGNGTADILWHNNNGQTVVWSMNGGQLVSGQSIGSVPDTSWHIAEVADFSGDGKADILWQNANGALTEWDMNGAQILSAHDIASRPEASWHIIASHYDIV
ncbi:FG-GAP-like repeat-containing protein [Tardiphaga sp. 619_E2_N8_5]|uniref:FG-GAP-like repeat-containing protein n=1 Tax=unclassified Tardiphaga TaxID=2631404 RepID=UPI003F25F06C